MRELLLALTDAAHLVAVCLFWLLAAALLTRLAWALVADAHAWWHQ